MASIDFPANPTLGQQFTAAGVTWVWDGQKWTPAGASSAVVQAMNDNRIINGCMRIDQRNNGTAINAANGYIIDRWAYATSSGIVSAGQSPTAPSGFGYSLWSQATAAHVSAAGDAYFFYQKIEADQVTDFAWGTTQAQPVTLSFWAASSLTGTFSGSINNGAVGTRCYPFTFSLPTANTFTKIVINIPADTSGAWTLTGNGAAVQISFDLGCGSTYRAPANTWVSGNYLGATGAVSLVGTNGATFYLTGVKLEIGSVATPFNRQSLAKSLADCQRYYEFSATAQGFYGLPGTFSYVTTYFAVPKRAQPTVVLSNFVGGNATALTVNGALNNCFSGNATVTTAGNAWLQANFAASAEL